ncbi:Allergen Asp f 7 [Termitomyces sp. J132]|nr:hypothetical protein H2248_009850 [Termitomyces sp. 'cryptogamus']KNZ75440.1 Allergen Asp f 7 [Termitomyces sp. J132]
MLAGLCQLSLLLATPLVAWANPHGSFHHNRHVEIAKRQTGDVQLFKRFSSARWTFYDVGLGACGKYNVASDFIVALNSAQYGGGYPGPYCFKQITMTYNGKTATATIMDECPGCPFGGLDLSRGLFTFFAPESVGVLYGTWSFNDGSSDDDNSPPPPPKTSKYVAPTTSTKYTPKTTPTWTPDPTTYWTPDPTTTTSKKTSTTYIPHTSSSLSTSHSSTASSSSSKYSSSTSSVHATSSSTTPSATPSSTDSSHNLAALEQCFFDLGVLVVAAA